MKKIILEITFENTLLKINFVLKNQIVNVMKKNKIRI